MGTTGRQILPTEAVDRDVPRRLGEDERRQCGERRRHECGSCRNRSISVPRTTRERVPLDNKDDATYPLPMTEEVKHNRRRGRTRISGKHQVTLPVDALAGAGLKVGDRLRADVSGPGQITLVREDDPLEQFAGALTGVYPEGYLDDLRREWT